MDEETIKKLEIADFRYCACPSLSWLQQVPILNNSYSKLGFKKEDVSKRKDEGNTGKSWCNFVQCVTCNQEEIIDFLIANRISFQANIHYEHVSMIYDGKTDELIIAQNFGKQILMDAWPGKYTGTIPEPIKKTTGAEYMKGSL